MGQNADLLKTVTAYEVTDLPGRRAEKLINITVKGNWHNDNS